MTDDPHKSETGQDLQKNLEILRSVFRKLEAVEPPELLNKAVLNVARRELDGIVIDRKDASENRARSWK